MKNFDAWLPWVRLAGASREESIDAIRAAARDFCDETLTWQCVLDAQSVEAGVASYPYDLPSGADISLPLDGWFKETPIALKTPAQINEIYRCNWLNLTGTPAYFTHVEGTCMVRLVPTPDTTEELVLVFRVALRPLDTASTIDDSLFTRHRDAIAAGARARLKMTTGKPYYDLDGAKIDEGSFRWKVAAEKIRVNNAFGAARQTATNPFGKFA